MLDEIVFAVSGIELITADQAVFEPEYTQSFKIPHGGGESEFFDGSAIGIGSYGEVKLVRLITEYGGDDEDMSAIGGKAFDSNRHLQLLDATRAQEARVGLQGKTFSPLAGVKLARFEFAEGHAGTAWTGTRDDRFDSDEVDEFRTGVVFREDAHSD